MAQPQMIEGWKPVDFIPMPEAVYCEDCNGLTRAKNGHCPRCGLGSIVHVEKQMRGEICSTPLDWWMDRRVGRVSR